MKKAVLLFVLAGALARAHVISMSSADLRVEGNRATYDLRMPLYEVQHIQRPEKTLLDNITFESAGVRGKLIERSCREDPGDGAYRCRGVYEWPAPVEIVDVVCTFYQVTVPNHVHLIHAYMGGKSDQAVFDYANPKGQIRFRPPTAFEVFVTASGSGFARAFSSAAAILFLGCLVLAARGRKELLLLTVCFIAGEVAAAVVVPLTPWNPAPRFVEAALALTIAYLAVEILTLPQAGQRWAVAAVLGLFHGLSYALYLSETGYAAFPVLFGMGVAEALAIAALALPLSRMARIFSSIAPAASRVAASFLLVTGLAWFFLRLRS